MTSDLSKIDSRLGWQFASSWIDRRFPYISTLSLSAWYMDLGKLHRNGMNNSSYEFLIDKLLWTSFANKFPVMITNKLHLLRKGYILTNVSRIELGANRGLGMSRHDMMWLTKVVKGKNHDENNRELLHIIASSIKAHTSTRLFRCLSSSPMWCQWNLPSHLCQKRDPVSELTNPVSNVLLNKSLLLLISQNLSWTGTLQILHFCLTQVRWKFFQN